MESFSISKEKDVIYTSPVFEDHSYVSWNTCIAKSTNYTYLVTMQHSRQRRWDEMSFLVIRGLYGNIVFKNSMLRSGKDSHSFSLYYAILLNSTAHFISLSVPKDWKESWFDDSSWKKIRLGNHSNLYNGTHYFRSQFYSIPSSSSYELQLLYQYGAIIYINGIEIFRDHLPDGLILETTLSTDYYDQLDYHGIIRPTSDFTSSVIVLCIEEHFPDISNHAITMNYWLSLSLPSVSSLPCTVLSLDPILSSYPPLPSIQDLISFDLSTCIELSSPITLSIHFNSSTIPLINSLQFYTSSNPSVSPSDYSFYSSLSNHSLLHLQAIHLTNKPYEYSPILSPIIHHSSSSYSLSIPLSSQSILRLSQLQFLTCSLPYPSTLEFEHLFYNTTQFSLIHIHPQYTGFHNCLISPSLPIGLIMDPSSCQIDGYLKEVFTFTWFDVSFKGEKELVGHFGLKVEKGYCLDGNRRFGINEIQKQSCEEKQGAIVIGSQSVQCIVDNDSLHLILYSNHCFVIPTLLLGIISFCCIFLCIIYLFYRIYIRNRIMNEDYNVLFI